MTKKHFEEAAQIVSHMDRREEAELVARHFVELFRRFNSRFDTARFLRACGL